MEMATAPPLPQAIKLGDFADQYPPEAGPGLAGGASLASLMPSISTQGEDYSTAARSGQPATPGRGTSATALSPRTKGYAGGVTKSGKRRRRHPVAEIKGGWTLEEDARLKQLVETYGEGSWSKLVPYFSGRIGKQLRERWNHELRPDIQKGAWTEDEEMALVEQHRVHRNAWADIARALPGRTCNAVKNHWNATLRRVNRGGQRTLRSPVEIYMDELGLIDTRNRNRPLHRTHNFHGNSRATGSGNGHPGGRDGAIRWLPELAPAMKIPSAATEPGDVDQLQASLVLATEGLRMPSTPVMALSTPAMPAPAAVLPAASTALSVVAAQPAIQLDAHQIAEKWGHSNGLANHDEPQQEASDQMQNGAGGAHDAPATEPSLRGTLHVKSGTVAGEESGSAVAIRGPRSESPFPDPQAMAMSASAETATDSEESDADAETLKGDHDVNKRSRRAVTISRGESSDPDADEPGLRRSKRQRVSPQDDAFHFFNRTEADKEAQRKPHLEEAAMALLLLDVHSAPGKGEEDGDGLPRSARGRRLRPPSQRLDSDSSDDDGPPSPTVNIPSNARRRRTGWEGSLRGRLLSAGLSSAEATPKEHPAKLRQVADISTQTPPLPQPFLPPPMPPLQAGSGPDVKDAQTALYGVNAAVASSRGANGKTVYASMVNVRDKVAGFIVSLAGMSERWDKDASPALLRCRSGLGRSSDPKVVALRQAVLEKCMAFKGPPPNLAVAAMAALLAEMEPIVAAIQEAATTEESGQGRYAGPGSIMGSSSRPLGPPSRPVQRATTHHFKSNPPMASVAPPAASVQAPATGLNRAQMEAAMRALSNFPGLPLRPEMLVHAMANKGPPRVVTGHTGNVTSPRQASSPHMPLALTPRGSQGSASPLTALILPGLGGDKPGMPTAAVSAANPTLAAAMAGMPLAQMLHMGPGMSGRHSGHFGPPGPSRLGSGLPPSSPGPLPSSTTSLSLPVPAGGSGLTIRTTVAQAPSPSLASPVIPVSTPSQGPDALTHPAQPSTAASAPALQSFLAAMTHADGAPMAPAAMQPMQLPEATAAAAPGHFMAPAAAFSQYRAAAPQQSLPAVQPSAQAATPSSVAPAAL